MKYERIKELRIDHDYTQEYIAAKVKMKQPQYARYESGNRDFPVDILIKLAKIYNTSLDYIVGLTDEKNPYSRKLQKWPPITYLMIVDNNIFHKAFFKIYKKQPVC